MPLGPAVVAEIEEIFTLEGFPAPKVEQLDAKSGEVRVNIRWDDAVMKLGWWPGTIEFVELDSGQRLPVGLYTALIDTSFPEFAKTQGVKRFVCSPGNAQQRRILLTRGSWRQMGSWNLEWVL